MASGIEEYLLKVADPLHPIQGPLPSFLRGFLGGASHLYDIGLEAYLAAERVGLRKRERLPVPVVSIGNLTVGGTGKSPMTIRLCRKLKENGLRLAILSRGHGGSSQDVRVVSDTDGNILLTADDAGDEPVMLARSCPGIPVVVGKDRRQSGREALRRWPLDLLVLDDGFQYWQLARDLDIVLLDSKLPFHNGYPLPRGLLREPKRHLKRGHIAIVTRSDRLDSEGRSLLTSQVHELNSTMPVYYAVHQPVGLVSMSGSDLLPLDTLQGKSVVALSGIAQPQSFLDTLTMHTGCTIAQSFSYSDHHKYTLADAAEITQTAQQANAVAIVMTEKDAVKWPSPSSFQGEGQGEVNSNIRSTPDVNPQTDGSVNHDRVGADPPSLLRMGLGEGYPIPIYALRIEMTIENEDAVIEEILQIIKG